MKYALRLCAEHKHYKACVHIYTTMGLYEEAVDLALQVRHRQRIWSGSLLALLKSPCMYISLR